MTDDNEETSQEKTTQEETEGTDHSPDAAQVGTSDGDGDSG